MLKRFVNNPLFLKRIMRPIPCEIEGINIGRVNITLKIVLNLIFVLEIAQARAYAKTTEIDTLSAIVATLCDADLLVLLTDVDGLYDRNPSLEGAKHIPYVEKITAEMIASAKGTGSEFSSGGMLTKLEAAGIAKENGIPTVIINGEDPEILYDLFENKEIGTLFKAKSK